MSESETHSRLVAATLRAVHEWADGATLDIWADHPATREHPAPFVIGQSQADLIAIRRDTRFTVIGEAKTQRDVDNAHTHRQLVEYYEFLLTQTGGLLWISVPFGIAGTALRVAKTLRREVKCERVELIVSEWLLDDDREFETRWNA